MPPESRETKSDFDRIEDLVRKRRTQIAHREILEFIDERGRADEDALMQACDWLRRLGMYFEGYRLLDLEESLKSDKPARGKLGRRVLMAARFLNQLGATQYALALLERIKPTSAVEMRVMAGIYLANFEHQKARDLFRDAAAAEKDHGLYDHRLGLIHLADAHAGLEDYDRAIRTVEKTLASSPEPLLQSICVQAIGEYHARAGRYAEARELLERSLALIPEGESSQDRGFLLKWLGYARARLGDVAEGRRLLEEAWDVLRAPGQREETWLDVQRLRAELGWVGGIEVERLTRYPGLPAGFPLPVELKESRQRPYRFGPARATIVISLDAGEVLSAGTWHPSLPLEFRLLGMVFIAGEWGLSRARARGSLWPSEVHAYAQQDQRLDQLVGRLRKVHGYTLKTEEGIMRLVGVKGLAVELTPGDPRPSFVRALAPGAEFVGEEIQEHYGISRPQRFVLLKRWLEEGWVARTGKPPATRFAVAAWLPGTRRIPVRAS